ncbi:hypothetical protein DFR86_01020 [Acidianus sulfidivorans JP7]|uniref:Uncharacterized protein n=1 Tax=Acidianus sulfidivorans JP7 TaxID=619593 RepID=A0A2U9IJQ7_9CREN|nr:hypothetical protein [Acidianus sulfidivorans]AWR96263.1 hypothetical protein DFR86_01020 [Acidianus sulfidivorans JP7]
MVRSNLSFGIVGSCFSILTLLVLFSALFLVFPVFHASSLVIKPGDFFAYNVTDEIYLPNGSVSILKQVDLFRVLSTFPNNTILTNWTIYNINSTSYFSPSVSLSNASVPLNLYYISPSLLGKQIDRGGELLNSTFENGFYVYHGFSRVGGETVNFTMWVNQNGVAYKVQSIDLAGSEVVGNTTAVLWLTNFYNSSVHLPTFKGYTLAKTVPANLNSSVGNELLGHKLMEYIAIFGIIGIIVILIFRK